MTARFEPAVVRQLVNGQPQHLYRLDNGYGASVIGCNGAPGGKRIWWDLAVIVWDGDEFAVVFDTPIAHLTLDSLSADEVQETLAEIAALPRGEAS